MIDPDPSAAAPPDADSTRRRLLAAFAAGLLPLAGVGPAFGETSAPETSAPPSDRPPSMDRALAARVLALDPDAVGTREIAETLAFAPAPRVIGLHGSVPVVTMAPFAEFLAAMGYPRERLRNPADGSFTYSSYVEGPVLAGILAWHYEREGAMPILIGHSQGGMASVRALHALAGTFGAEVRVWDPVRDRAEARTSIVDPFSGATRPVVELRVPYAAAIATGKVMRVLLGQWGMLDKVHEVPDSVELFTGFFIDGDPLTGTVGGRIPGGGFRATGRAQVDNVLLPSSYSHVGAPLADHLAADPRTREWIDRFDPRQPPPPAPEGDTRNLLHAARIWAEVKRQWCLAAQRFARHASGGVA
jgi:hypothetical protein